ncbi:hypothetical protein KQX54_001036 [Cotesia glomerata]|uniref:Uncharacterized protein n=1 Tax=Cotesia glomerata TaxID=32391 RepID=A0AAV7IW89_COTGL|nr:hypothetical protein KQX54_007573 [Cotesia glomerata]KAH0559026.1 hypothetical protein KQX54_001036 [Cotesia glomerata]
MVEVVAMADGTSHTNPAIHRRKHHYSRFDRCPGGRSGVSRDGLGRTADGPAWMSQQRPRIPQRPPFPDSRRETSRGFQRRSSNPPQAREDQRPATHRAAAGSAEMHKRADLTAFAVATESWDEFEELDRKLSMFFQGVTGSRPVGGRGARDARRDQGGNPEAERYLQQDQAGQGSRIHAATRIQKLYRENRRKAMQEILNEPSPFCQVPKDEVDRHFRTMYSDDSPLETDLPERQVWPPD